MTQLQGQAECDGLRGSCRPSSLGAVTRWAMGLHEVWTRLEGVGGVAVGMALPLWRSKW